MARVALDLGIRDLAELAQVAPATVSRFEAGEELKPRTIAAMRAALEAAGVEFIDGERPGAILSLAWMLHRVADRAFLETALNEIGRPDWKVERTSNGLVCQNQRGEVMGSVRVGTDQPRPVFEPSIGALLTEDRAMPGELRSWIVAMALGDAPQGAKPHS